MINNSEERADDEIDKLRTPPWLTTRRLAWYVGAASLAVVVLPVILSQKAWPFYELMNVAKGAAVGDAIGGITAPVLSLLSALLVYAALHEQVIANERLRQMTVESARDDESRYLNSLIDRVEDKAFSLYQEIAPELGGTPQSIDTSRQLDQLKLLLYECKFITARLAKLPDRDTELGNRLILIYSLRIRSLAVGDWMDHVRHKFIPDFGSITTTVNSIQLLRADVDRDLGIDESGSTGPFGPQGPTRPG